jgi:hypothetical protein
MIRTELTLRLPNSPGAAATVCQLLASERVQISALSLAPSGHLRIVVDNPVRALGVLREQHHRVETREVVLVSVPATADALAPLLRLVSSAGINVDYAYTASSGSVVLGVDDAQRAAAVAGV